VSALAAVASFGAATAAATPGPGVSPNTAPADPNLSHRIEWVNAQLDRLSRRNDQLDEQYNVAAAAVTAAQHKATRAQQAANRAQARFRAAHAQFVRAVTLQYENAFAPSAGEMLSSSSAQQYVDGLALTDYMSSRFAATVDAQRAAQADADQATGRAATALTAARSKAAALATRRTALQRQAHRFHQLLDTLTVQQQQQLAEARAVAAAKARAALNTKHHKTTLKTGTETGTGTGTQHAPGSGGHHAPAPPVTGPVSARIQRVIDYAEAQVGKYYSYGGAGPSAYDCSGLTMASYAQVGVHLPHSAAGQYGYGTHVSYSQLQPGDLIFLYSPIGHVELYVGHDLAVSAADPSIGIVYVHPSNDMGSYVGATRLIG
jgi:cell wall-associated NlpC family hydrolase